MGKSRSLVGVGGDEINPDQSGGRDLDLFAELSLKIWFYIFRSFKITDSNFQKCFRNIFETVYDS